MAKELARAKVVRQQLDRVEQAEQLPLTGRRRDIIDDVVVEHDQPSRIALPISHVRQRSGDETRVINLVNLVRAVRHRCGGVEQNQELAVGLAAIALEEAFIGPREHVPVDVAEVVALGVSTVFGKFLGETEVGRAVEAGDETVDYRLGDQVEAGDGVESGGV